MTENLITLDLGGLLNQLNGIEEGVIELKTKVQTHTKSIAASDKQLLRIKDKQGEDNAGIRNEIATLVKSFEDTSKSIKEIDGLVVKLKDNLSLQDAKERTQADFNTAITSKFNKIKNDGTDFETKTLDKIGKLTLQTEFTSVTNSITERVVKIEGSSEELKTSLQSADTQLQELLDRVETIETHGVQPKKLPEPVVVVQENTDVADAGKQVQQQDDAIAVDKPFIEEVNPHFIEEVKLFARAKLEQYEAQTRLELFNTTLEHFEQLRETEKEYIATFEVEVPFEYGAESIEPVPVPTPKYNYHMPSQIERIFENHVRQVSDKIVWLETLKPAFQMEDGRLQLGSDYQQVFSHVEVQTFQQQQMIKNQNQDSLNIRILQQEIENLKNQLQDQSRRVDQLEVGADIDLSHLQIDGAGLKELFRIMQDMKTEILQKVASNDTIKNIQRDFNELRNQNLKNDFKIDSNLRDDIQAGLAQMAQFPSQLMSLQVQLMKSETLCYDVDRHCQTLIGRVDSIENISKELSKAWPSQTSEQSEEQLEKIKDFQAMKYYFASQFATLDQHNSFTEATLKSLGKLDELNRVAEENKRKMLDNSKLNRTNQATLKQIIATNQQLKLDQNHIENVSKTKVSQDTFNEELGYLKHMIIDVGKGKKPSQAPSSGVKSLLPPPGGMTAGMKNQIKEMMQTVERHDAEMKLIQQGIQEISVTELKDQVSQVKKQLPLKVPQENFAQMELKMTSDLHGCKAQMKSQSDEAKLLKNTVEQKLDHFTQTNSERDTQIADFAASITKFEQQIAAIKSGAGSNNKSKLLPRGHSSKKLNMAMDSDDNDEQELVNKMRQELSALSKHYKASKEAFDQKLKVLWPLVDPEQKGKKSKRSDLENRLTDQIFAQTSRQQEENFKLRNELDELKRTFEEKIRRQALVQQKLKPQAVEGENKSLKKRPKFLAQQMTRELLVNGRLPQFENYGDHIARYGKGFSQMLNMATDVLPNQIYSPRLVGGVSLGELSNSYDYEPEHHLNNLLTNAPTFNDTLSQQSQRKQKLYQATSDKEMEITENAPTVDPNLTTRVHPSTKGLSYKQKREDLRAANMTTQPVLVEQEESQFLPIIPTHRSITQVGPQDDQQEE